MIWTLTQYKEWPALEKKFSWVDDMKRVPHHKRHHAEGDVAIHTQMVLAELDKIEDFHLLTEQDKEIIWTAALMHDIEKRSTSVDEGNGNISANGHARKGEYTTRAVLYRDVPTPFLIREHIASLVRYHGTPLWLPDKENPAKRVHEVSLRLNTQFLKILATADAKGRICEDPESLINALTFFEMLCKEQKCWGETANFTTPHARFHYFNTPESHIEYVPYDNFKCEVTLLSGLPGMGKNHYIQSTKKDIPVVSMNNIRRKNKINPTVDERAIQEAKEEARVQLRKGQDFIWNATNITKQLRSQLISLFIDYGARVKIVYIEQPYHVWKEQNMNREYPLPENALDKMLDILEIPQLTEAHEVEYIVN